MATHRLTSTIINRTLSQAGIHYKYCTASVSPSASLWSASSNTLLHRWVIDLLRGERAGQLVGVRNWVELLEHPSHPVQDQQFPLHLYPTICGFNQAQKKNTSDYGLCIYFIMLAIIVGHIVSCNDIILLTKREGHWRKLPCPISRSQRNRTKLRNQSHYWLTDTCTIHTNNESSVRHALFYSETVADSGYTSRPKNWPSSGLI
jgi:hypothetical protein